MITNPDIKPKRRIFRKIVKYTLLSILVLIIGFIIYFFQAIKMFPPEVADKSALNEKREVLGDNFYAIKNNRFRKNTKGYEWYLP